MNDTTDQVAMQPDSIFPACPFSGIVSRRSGKRLCRLHDGHKFVPLDTCRACPFAELETSDLVPICNQPSPKPALRGLGDVVAAATSATGIDKAVKAATKALGIKDCGCKARQEALNRAVPFGAKSSPQQNTSLSPLVGPANLMWFVYPRRQTCGLWKAQQETIREAIGRFDGKKVCAIAVDDSTDAAAIDKTLWDEVIELPNNPRHRELPGWRWAMEKLRGQPGFTIRLHAKGAWRGAQEQHLVRWWELAYETLLNVDAVRGGLEQSAITGVFRRNVPAANLGVAWHYTGSMYAFRNDWVFGRDWEPRGKVDPAWYVEAWPALVAPRDLVGCLRFDGVGDLYRAKSWKDSSDSHAIVKPAGNPPATVSKIKQPPSSPKTRLIEKKPSDIAATAPRIAPLVTAKEGWAGSLRRKPWDYRVTAAIPVINTVEPLPLVIETLRLQTERPYIVLVDTGSVARRNEIEALRAEDVEVHWIMSHGWRHPSEPITAALDFVLSCCHTPYLFTTHSDCFLKRRELLAEMVGLCRKHHAVGYQLSPRPHPDWEWMLGHTCTMFDVATLDRINASWSLRRLCNNRGVELKPEVCGPNWPDTELLINYQLRDAGVKSYILGSERNRERTNDENIDHCRSLPSAGLYDSNYARQAGQWMVDAVIQAKARIAAWRAAP